MGTLSGAQRDMQRKYRDAGNDWSDSKYQQLGDIVNECSSSIRKTLHELNGCFVSLNNIEQIVAEYESINLVGSESFRSDNGSSRYGASHVSSDGAFANTGISGVPSELRLEYFDGLRMVSDYPDSIVDDGNSWSRIDSAENVIMREDFDKSKRDLIAQWEADNGIPWPIYNEDIYMETGSIIRRAGHRYDAHHIQPLTFGGRNIAANITPLHVLEHFDKRGVHAPDSPCGRIERLLTGGVV
jgi:hypothetical protein